MLLSIIVPVYNVQKYLAKCLESLLNQDVALTDYEIIIINDGSTDGSETIAQQYATNHTNVKLITQPNGGLSAARNTGIKEAEGKYVQFVDSDDYIAPNCLASLMHQIVENNLEILRYNYQNVNENYEVLPKSKKSNVGIVYADKIETGISFLVNSLGFACYACMYIINRDLLISNSLYFKDGIYFEDTEWLPRVLLKTTRIASTPAVVYYYLQRQGSITKSVDVVKKRKVLHDLLQVMTSIQEVSKTYPSLKQWQKIYTSYICINYLRYLTNNLYEERVVHLKELKKTKNFPIVKTSTISYVQLIVINISPRFFMKLIKIKHKI